MRIHFLSELLPTVCIATGVALVRSARVRAAVNRGRVCAGVYLRAGVAFIDRIRIRIRIPVASGGRVLLRARFRTRTVHGFLRFNVFVIGIYS